MGSFLSLVFVSLLKKEKNRAKAKGKTEMWYRAGKNAGP
jgi:hypothetical protein